MTISTNRNFLGTGGDYRVEREIVESSARGVADWEGEWDPINNPEHKRMKEVAEAERAQAEEEALKLQLERDKTRTMYALRAEFTGTDEDWERVGQQIYDQHLINRTRLIETAPLVNPQDAF